MALVLCACQVDLRAPALGSPRETLSDANHGAAVSAVDAMDHMAADPLPDTEAHLSLSPAQQASPDDSTRADLLLIQIREALRKYSDVRVAGADGFEELPATEGKHAIHHLSNWTWARAEGRHFNPAHPTSLLYRESADGNLTLIGAMYTAPATSTMPELDERIPLGLARWHRHVNWCAPKAATGAQWLASHDGTPSFGPKSPIATRDACTAVGGVFYPAVFGWMVHVTFVGSDDPRIVWNGSLPPSSLDSTGPRDTGDHVRAVQVAAAPLAATATATPATPAPVAPRPVAPRPVAPAPIATPRHRVNGPPEPRHDAAEVPQPSPVIATSNPAPPTHVAQPPERREPTVFAASGRSSSVFTSGHRTIAYDRFVPATPGPHPAILLLHGDGGLPAQAVHFEEFATALTRHDYVVEIVHYFDRTATVASDPADRVVHFREWQGTIRDALSDLAHAPGVDSTRLGIFGTGLGASLALSVGAQDRRVSAVVEYEGSLPAWAATTVRRMPAVLIGESDADAPPAVREADRVQAICDAAKAPVEVVIYQAPNRIGRGTGVKDLRQRTLSFLEKYLKQPR